MGLSGKAAWKRVLGEWTEPLPGYHLYFPDRRHSFPAF